VGGRRLAQSVVREHGAGFDGPLDRAGPIGGVRVARSLVGRDGAEG
jgi:hypothetical protein